MKHIFALLLIFTVALSSCSTPTAIPTPIPTKDKTIIGTYYDDYSPSLPYTLIIKKINGTYNKTEIYSDGSQQTITLVANNVNGEERLVEEGNDGYFGDYMVIESNGDVAFYDKQGLIYRLHPK